MIAATRIEGVCAPSDRREDDGTTFSTTTRGT